MGLYNPNKILKLHNLISSDKCLFVATGITENILLKGIVLDTDSNYVTHSLLLNGQNKHIRYIECKHSNYQELVK